MELNQPFSQEEVLSDGVQAQPAMRLLALIESRTAYLMAQTQRAIAILLNVNAHAQPESSSNQMASRRKQATERVTIHDLERYAPQWANLVPDDANVQAAITNLLEKKYTFTYDALPAIRQALALDSQAVQQAYESQYEQPLATLFRVDEGDDDALHDDNALKEAQKEHKDNYSDIEAELEWIELAKGDFLFRQGDVGDSLYLLMHGRLRVLLEQNGVLEPISEIGPGEIFGEMALITGDKRSATLIAIRDTSLFKLEKISFERLIERRPQVMMQIARIQAQRVRRLSNRRPLPTSLVTLAVVPISKEVPLTEFCQRLVAAFSTYGQTRHLNRQRVDDQLEEGAAQSELHDPENSRVVAWLSEQEMRYRFVIYESDADLSATPWTKRCIRQADQILLVGWASSNPQLSEIELLMGREMQGQPIASARQSLVLLHPDGAEPVGTSKWLSPRQVQRHHHLRWKQESDPADFKRLARLYTGRAIGLVFGSGGARGMAHIGVLRAIEELGLEIDLVGGTSFGALIAALYAIGLDSKAMCDVAKEFINPKEMFDYTLPMTSFFGGKPFTNIMMKLFGDRQIEDTWLEFFCVSSNLTRATEMIHQRGPLWKYVRATSSLPMFFPPVVDNGDLLIDGGLVNFLPLDVMSRLCAGGPVIGIDVALESDLAGDYTFGPSLSGWKVLWSRINPFQSTIQIPKPLVLFMRVIEFNRIRRNSMERNYADLYIRPPIEQFDMLEFESYEEMIEMGYQTALPQLKAWMELEGLNG